MRFVGVVAALALALVLQTTVAQLVVRGTGALDLVLVGVMYVALSYGPSTGLLATLAALRYKGADAAKKTLWLNHAERWGRIAGQPARIDDTGGGAPS